jgi:hypothetical protein
VPLLFAAQPWGLPAEPFAEFSRSIAGALPGRALLFADCLPHFGQVVAASLSPLANGLHTLAPGFESGPLSFLPRLEPVLPRCLSSLQAILLHIAAEFRALASRFLPLSPGVGAVIGPMHLSGGTGSQ